MDFMVDAMCVFVDIEDVGKGVSVKEKWNLDGKVGAYS